MYCESSNNPEDLIARGVDRFFNNFNIFLVILVDLHSKTFFQLNHFLMTIKQNPIIY